MMPNRSTDILFQLIQSLEKAEKRNFKLYIKRNSAKEDLKIIQLFDVLDKLPNYDEKILLKKLPTVEKPQLANLKTHLYKQILSSLRLLKATENIDLQLNEQIDHARILYNKGLYQQSLRILERAREMARLNHKYNFLTQVISLEKKIETLHITRSMQGKAERLARESIEVSQHIDMVFRLSNLALQLYSWYVKNGHARNSKDEASVKSFFKNHLPANVNKVDGFYEKLYLYQSYCWYAFILQDFLLYYRYSQKWFELFVQEPSMIAVETGHYIKGLHNLLNAHFDLRNFQQFQHILNELELFSATPLANQHDSFRIQIFVYINSAKINWHLMAGTFAEGLKLVPFIEERLKEYALYIDKHRFLVFNYKVAMLYFGNRQFNECLDFLHNIINDNVGMRDDLQCYARLLHLMAHYELGNVDIIESLMKSVYRFMTKMQTLTVIEEEMFKFLKNTFYVPTQPTKKDFENFLQTIKKHEKNRFETRSFAYLDIISWVESKVYNQSMSAIIYEKYMQRRNRIYHYAINSATVDAIN